MNYWLFCLLIRLSYYNKTGLQTELPTFYGTVWIGTCSSYHLSQVAYFLICLQKPVLCPQTVLLWAQHIPNHKCNGQQIFIMCESNTTIVPVTKLKVAGSESKVHYRRPERVVRKKWLSSIHSKPILKLRITTANDVQQKLTAITKFNVPIQRLRRQGRKYLLQS